LVRDEFRAGQGGSPKVLAQVLARAKCSPSQVLAGAKSSRGTMFGRRMIFSETGFRDHAKEKQMMRLLMVAAILAFALTPGAFAQTTEPGSPGAAAAQSPAPTQDEIAHQRPNWFSE
jgi:hypothetical protein